MMEYEKKILVDVIKSPKYAETIKCFFNIVPRDPKSAEASEIARKQGNTLYLAKKNHDALTHKAIFDHYCESIALAPMNSQGLALAFGNRSYFLLHIHKYEDSIKDIDRALEITNSDVLKAKLLCRKAECLKRLGSSDYLISTILVTAHKLIDKIDGKDKAKLLQMADAVKALIVSNNRREVEKSINQGDSLPITDDYLSHVSIQYNEKYGRHLVAAKDYKPGDIIFVEKIYASAFKECRSYSVCDYCSKPTWSSIPCNYCDWSMYCSASCKEKAWNNYHEIECTVVSLLKDLQPKNWIHNVISIRVLITAIQESGNIANLKEEIESLDKSTDNPLQGFFKDGQVSVSSIRNVYSLTPLVHREQLTAYNIVIPFILIGLTKYSKLKKYFNVTQVENLLINEDIMFLGTLLIKITSRIVRNKHMFQSDKEIQEYFRRIPFEIAHADERFCLSTLYSLLNHSCDPSADWCCIAPNKLLVYALQPIKKNSQIFICYHKSFNDEIQSKRQDFYLKEFNFTCDCQACVEMWPPLYSNSSTVNKDHCFGQFDEEKLMEVRRHLKKGEVTEEDIKKLSSLIMKGTNWKPPPISLWISIVQLRQVFIDIYAPKALLFDHCK